MDENMRNTIASIKSVIKTTRGQLEEMEQESDPDRQLMAVVQGNYERAKSMLRLLEKINGVEATAAVQPAEKSSNTATTKAEAAESESINVTRHVDHSFQVIPPEAVDNQVVNATSTASQTPQESATAQESSASSSTDVHMTRAEYRAMLKKKGK
ncbi:hypothetical protein [Limosilactobacillus fermentum]|uniref:hypothetical protein n=1 Tax=Limosilactobacillus fermentum TaxID=1613 RepID=UPI00352AF4FE